MMRHVAHEHETERDGSGLTGDEGSQPAPPLAFGGVLPGPPATGRGGGAAPRG
jgi:hypothetical protein